MVVGAPHFWCRNGLFAIPGILAIWKESGALPPERRLILRRSTERGTTIDIATGSWMPDCGSTSRADNTLFFLRNKLLLQVLAEQ